MKKKKHILICPLNWGLGHATRVVPIIKACIRLKFDITLAADGDALIFLKKEFPELKTIILPNYKVRYSKSNGQIIKMVLLAPSIVYWTVKEHFWLKKWIKELQIDVVISDNRYGLWNKHIYSVFITHQLNLNLPDKIQFVNFYFEKIIRWILKRFNECWVPDFAGENNLAGNLSHVKAPIHNLFYIGPLSRFKANIVDSVSQIEIDVLFILSGPEPQRTLFEEIIIKQIKASRIKAVLVRGTKTATDKPFDFPIFDILGTDELKTLIQKAELVICRSGYSSIMDLISLRKKAVLVPTPGQWEQEYLAGYLHKKGLFYAINQNEFDLEKSIQAAFVAPHNISSSIDTDELEKRMAQLYNVSSI